MSFERCIGFVFRHEGGYSNDPRDSGQETNFGISKRAYPDLDIKGLTEDAAKEIYRKDYWLKAGCDKLDWPLCLVHFDTAVNMGLARAMEIKAKAANWMDYLFLRIECYSRLAGSRLAAQAYLRGWLNRVLDLWKEAKKP